MFRCSRLTRAPLLRLYSTSPASKAPKAPKDPQAPKAPEVPEVPKASSKLVAALRKTTDVSFSKAIEALTVTKNDYDAALEWLKADRVISSALKIAKVHGRSTEHGLISQFILSQSGTVRAGMVELNCETDFVGRNKLFGKLATDIAHTAAALFSKPVQYMEWFEPCPLDRLLKAPLMSQEGPHPSETVESSIGDLITKVGENISLRRAIAVIRDPDVQPQRPSAFRLASYVHGAPDFENMSSGRIGVFALLALKSERMDALFQSKEFIQDLELLERSIGRQIVGFETLGIQTRPGETDEAALYDQPFMMYTSGNGRSVREVLAEWKTQRGLGEDGLEVMEFEKWEVGGG